MTAIARWLRSWLREPAKPIRTRAPRGFAPRLDVLEGRDVPAVFNVTNLADAGIGSLRQAVAFANASPGPDTINFAPTLAGTIAISAPTTPMVVGAGGLTINGNLGVTVSGNGWSRIFETYSPSTILTVNNITLANGFGGLVTTPLRFTQTDLNGGGAILAVGGRINLNGVTLSSNTAFATNVPQAFPGIGPAALGGAVLMIGPGSILTANSTNFNGNTASGFLAGGGAVELAFGATGSFTGSSFLANAVSGYSTAAGGAIGVEPTSSATISTTVFNSNSASVSLGADPVTPAQGMAFGGAVANMGGTSVTVNGGSFTNNYVAGGYGGNVSTGLGGNGMGGAIANAEIGLLGTVGAGAVRVTGTSFVSNYAYGGTSGFGLGEGGMGVGGAIFNANVLTVASGRFQYNAASGGYSDLGTGLNDGVGGAIANVSGSTTVTGGTFTANGAYGGIDNIGTAAGDGVGGAIASTVDATFGPSVLAVSLGATFTSNVAYGGSSYSTTGGAGRGGAIFVESGSGTITTAIFTSNSAYGGYSYGFLGIGGAAAGGALAVGSPTALLPATVTITSSTVQSNTALGGAAFGFGFGGAATGGGIDVQGVGTSLALNNTRVFKNRAAGGSGNVVGTGRGGGVAVTGGATATRLAAIPIATLVFQNTASTSNPDILGTITPV